MPNLNEAAEDFHNWMNDFEDSHREQGHYEDHNKALVDFLSQNLGFYFVKTYEDFVN